jgi:hypothetical protein
MAKKRTMYFTQDTEDAIVLYNSMTSRYSECCEALPVTKENVDEDNIPKIMNVNAQNVGTCSACDNEVFFKTRVEPGRDALYREKIQPAFSKLVENIIHTFKFYNFPESPDKVIHEVVAFLIANIHKFNPDNGKAFSYFSIVVKHYLILHNNRNYKHKTIHDPIDNIDYNRNVTTEHLLVNDSEDRSEFLNYLIDFWDNNMTVVFKRKKDIDVANSVIYLLETAGNIENFNKKYLYVLIREMTNSKTQHITRIVNVMKKYNTKLTQEYITTGYVNTETTGSSFA